MGFDFNQIKYGVARILPEIDDSLYFEFHKITDIPEISSGVTETTALRKGFWEADRYFTMQLIPQLLKLGLKQFQPEMEVLGNTFITADANGYLGDLHGLPVFLFNRTENLDAPVKLINFVAEKDEFATAMLENTPILVFQNYDGPIAVTWQKSSLELDQKAYHCHKDAIVFKGVYKAVRVKDGKYKLERIFNKYFFDSENARYFNPEDTPHYVYEVKIKQTNSESK